MSPESLVEVQRLSCLLGLLLPIENHHLSQASKVVGVCYRRNGVLLSKFPCRSLTQGVLVLGGESWRGDWVPGTEPSGLGLMPSKQRPQGAPSALLPSEDIARSPLSRNHVLTRHWICGCLCPGFLSLQYREKCMSAIYELPTLWDFVIAGRTK